MLLKIDIHNPVLGLNNSLKEMLILRRKCHKLFDLIKCDKWETWLADNDLE